MFLHTAVIASMLSIIILLVILSVPKVASCFPNILFSTALTGQQVNRTIIVTVHFMVYMVCLASNITGILIRFRDILAYFKPFFYHI